MGCTFSGESREYEDRNAKIDKDLRNEYQNNSRRIKLLLLGAGETGKSTIIKQMRIMHTDGFSNDELLKYKPVIYMTMLQNIVHALNTPNLCHLNSQEFYTVLNEVCQKNDENSISDSVFKSLEAAWNEPTVVKYIKDNHLNDSVQYYFESFERVIDSNYLPTPKDVLMARIKTTGIIETSFILNKVQFNIIDVGGQLSERKKWIHCFDDVQAVIFVVALSDYNKTLAENPQVKRFDDTKNLLESISTNPYFKDASFIIFLNKKDQFSEMIKKESIKVMYEDYSGDDSFDDSVNFIKSKLLSKINKDIYVQCTCATDTDQFKFVMSAVIDIIIKQNLRNCGLF